MTMRRILATPPHSGPRLKTKGPVKTGWQQQQGSRAGQQPGMSEQISTLFIGERRALNAVALYFREKAITASVNDQTRHAGTVGRPGTAASLHSGPFTGRRGITGYRYRSITRIVARRPGVWRSAAMLAQTGTADRHRRLHHKANG